MHAYYKKYLTIYIILILSISYSSFIDNNYSITNIRINEIESIKNNSIESSLYKFPNFQLKYKSSNEGKYNFLNKFNYLNLNPVLGLRFSTISFEMNPLITPSPTIWVSPGIQFSFITPIISPYSGFMFHAWGAFYKHSAYFMDKSEIDISIKNVGLNPFEYNPYLSMEYFTKTKEPSWGVDFDEGQGGIGIYSKNLKVNFGKFKSSIGPFHRGNLSLSLKSPSIPQFRINYKKSNTDRDIFEFSYIIGDLISEIPDSSIIPAYSIEQNGKATRLPWINRGFIQHRIDLFFTKTFRIGFYEQLIWGARATPWQYLIPITPFWSAQHATGDFDNLQMGFDIDWIHHNGRTNIAFIMDEWAPFSTFDMENHHNWFGVQIGHSQLFSILNNDFYFRNEYAFIAPQIYEHKFPINQSYNQGYPIGYWSKGDSFDFWFTLTWLNESKLQSRIEAEYTIFGEPLYEVNRKYLKNKTFSRGKLSFILDYKIQKHSIIEFQLSSFKTNNLNYNPEQFIDCTINYKYNISY